MSRRSEGVTNPSTDPPPISALALTPSHRIAVHGRVHPNENSEVNGTASPALIDKPYAWSKVANTLYVSQPKGVGFSYCDDLTVECANNDKVAAEGVPARLAVRGAATATR